MTALTGRTTSNWIDFIVQDSGATLRSIPVNTINGLGLNYEETDLTAFQDAIKGALLGQPDCSIDIAGPFDTTAAASAGTLSGSHTILSAIVGVLTPLAIDVQVGIRAAWESGAPQFGITSTATSGFLCSNYSVDVGAGTYTAKFVMFPGSSAPAWGTAAETAVT